MTRASPSRSRFRLSPTPAQETALLGHCAQARFVWNLALEQANSYGTAGRTSSPNFAAQCRQLTEARAEHAWLAAGSQTVQQQARRVPRRVHGALGRAGHVAHPQVLDPDQGEAPG